MFHPLCLGRPAGGVGFWQAKGYPQWMAGVVRDLLRMTETYRGAGLDSPGGAAAAGSTAAAE